jgi:hypothetical protein
MEHSGSRIGKPDNIELLTWAGIDLRTYAPVLGHQRAVLEGYLSTTHA